MGAHLTGFVQDALLLVIEEEEVGARLSQVLEDAQVPVRGSQVERGALLQIVFFSSFYFSSSSQVSMEHFQHKPHLKVASVEVEFFVEEQLHQVSVASHCDVVQRGQPAFGK